MDVITASNLTHHYGTKKVFENLNFSVKQGKITGLLGKNGTGKTTLINIINNFLIPSTGEVALFGQPAQALTRANKARIGYLIEGHIQYDFMSIAQIERFYSGFYPRWNARKYYELIDLMHLKPSHKIAKMSCGQRSQVALGLIFAQEPELLILDDFSMGLDPGYRRLFIDYLKHYVSTHNLTVFVTSHIVQDMEKLINEVMIFDDYQIKYQEQLSEFLNSIHIYTAPKTREFQRWCTHNPQVLRSEELANEIQLVSRLKTDELQQHLAQDQIMATTLTPQNTSLEDAFVALTGRY